MFTIIGGDGQEYGPATAEQIRAWIEGGRANLQTRARRQGETEWKTLGDFPELTGAAAHPGAGPGAPRATFVPTGAIDARSFAAALNARAAKIDPFECLGRSFNLWKSNFLPLVGVTLLVLVVQMMIGIVPVLGALAGIFLNGVFYGGLYYYYLGKLRGERREVADVFAGFTRAFVPLMLASLISTAISLVVMTVFAGPLFFSIFSASLHGSNASFPAVSALSALGMFVGLLLIVYLSVSWIFAFILIMDKGVSAWTALEISRRVVGRQWFRVFLLLLLAFILTMLGVIAFFIGMLFTLPLMFGAVVCAYEEACNPPAEPEPTTPVLPLT